MCLPIVAIRCLEIEVFFGCSCPPNTSFDYLSHKVIVVALPHIVVKVVLSNYGFYVAVFRVHHFIKLLQKLFIRLVHEISLLESMMVKQAIDLRGLYVEKLKEGNVLSVCEFSSLLKYQEDKVVDSLDDLVYVCILKVRVWLQVDFDFCLSHIRMIVLVTTIYYSVHISDLRETLILVLELL